MQAVCRDFLFQAQGLDAFQQQRFEALRSTNSYAGLPPSFLQYYTYMPAGADYDSIRALTASLVAEAGAKTNIDKVLAVRDYFLKNTALMKLKAT